MPRAHLGRGLGSDRNEPYLAVLDRRWRNLLLVEHVLLVELELVAARDVQRQLIVTFDQRAQGLRCQTGTTPFARLEQFDFRCLLAAS